MICLQSNRNKKYNIYFLQLVHKLTITTRVSTSLELLGEPDNFFSLLKLKDTGIHLSKVVNNGTCTASSSSTSVKLPGIFQPTGVTRRIKTSRIYSPYHCKPRPQFRMKTFQLFLSSEPQKLFIFENRNMI